MITRAEKNAQRKVTQLKIGQKLISKTSGASSEIADILEREDGILMYQVWNTYYTKEQLREKFWLGRAKEIYV